MGAWETKIESQQSEIKRLLDYIQKQQATNADLTQRVDAWKAKAEILVNQNGNLLIKNHQYEKALREIALKVHGETQSKDYIACKLIAKSALEDK